MEKRSSQEVVKIEGKMEPPEFNQFAKILIGMALLVVLLTLPVSFFFCFKAVQEYERAIIYRLGRPKRGQSKNGTTGIFFVLPCIDSYVTINGKPRAFPLVAENVTTKNGEMVTIELDIYHYVTGALRCVLQGENPTKPPSIGTLGQSTLREIVKGMGLRDIFSQTSSISKIMQENMNKVTEVTFGIKVARVDVKDVKVTEKNGVAVMNVQSEMSDPDVGKNMELEGQRDLKIMQTLLQASTPIEY